MGCANIARRYMNSAIIDCPDTELVAVASRTEEKANAFGKEFSTDAVVGYENLLRREDVDAIYMPLPTGLHHEWIKKSIEAGKHVLAEKSLALNYESAKELVELASRKSLVLMENFQFQHHSQNLFVKSLIEEGVLGELRVLRASFGFPPLPADNFRYDKSAGGGALLDAGAYMLKVSQYFLGTGLEVIAADRHFDKAMDVDLHGSAYLRSSSGLCSEVAWGFDNFYQCNYELWGSKAKISATRAYTAAPGFEPKVIIEQQGTLDERLLSADNHFVNILSFFSKSVKNGDIEVELHRVLDQARMISEVEKLSHV